MPNRYKDIYDLLLDLDEKGVSVILSFTKDGEEHYFLDPEEIDFIPTTKENIRWLCSGCYEEQNVTLASLLASYRVLPIRCRGCTMSAKSNGYTNYKFRDLLQKENWEYCDDLSKEIVIKSMDFVNAKCNKGHPVKTTPNKWKNEHRCKFCANDNKRNDSESVKEEIEEKGFKLPENFNYVSNATIMPVTCSRCGNETEMTLGNIRKNIGGCRECSGRTLFEEMTDFLEQNNKTFKSITVENKEEEYKQFILNEDYITYICNCNYNKPHRTTWRQIKEGAGCPNCAQKQREKTNIEKYGVDNPSKNKDIQEKIVNTNEGKTGYKYPMQNPESLEKMMKTNKKNHGGVHNFQTPEIRSMAYQGQLNKYGCMFLQSEEGKKKMMELYGVEHNMQNAKIFEQKQKNSFQRKEFTFPSGRIDTVQGYEPFALKKLLNDGIMENHIYTTNIPPISYIKEEKKCVYHPDIMIKIGNEIKKIIEVKSEYTIFLHAEMNLLKFLTISKLYNFEVWIFNAKGELIDILTFKN